MATGVSDQPILDSDEVIDLPCGFCLSDEDIQVESTHFCQDCDYYICQQCIKAHKKYPAMSGHRLVNVSSSTDAEGRPSHPLPSQRCTEHKGKLIDKYCTNHDQVACYMCINKYHGTCDDIKYIPTLVTRVKASGKLRKAQQSTDSVVHDLKEMKLTLYERLQELQHGESVSQQVLKNTKNRVVSRVEYLFTAESDKIQKTYQAEFDQVKDDIKAVDFQIEATETGRKMMNELHGNNQSEVFIHVKQEKKNTEDSKRLLTDMQQLSFSVPKHRLTSAFETSLYGIKSLGTFDKLAKAKKQKDISVKVASDKLTCQIPGICFLVDGTVLMADHPNKSLKHLDDTYKVKSVIEMPGDPLGICYIDSTNEVAVTLMDAKSVQLVSVGAKLKKTRIFSVGNYCRGICCSGNELYICCGDTRDNNDGYLGVYTVSGQPLRRIQTGLLTVVDNVTVSSDDATLHITDRKNGVVTVDKVGSFLGVCRDVQLKVPVGICTIENDDVLVSGFDSNNVIQFSSDGNMIGEVLNAGDGIRKPGTLCYDWVNARLIVYMDGSNNITLYKIGSR